jgi:hypothetical protein
MNSGKMAENGQKMIRLSSDLYLRHFGWKFVVVIKDFRSANVNILAFRYIIFLSGRCLSKASLVEI